MLVRGLLYLTRMLLALVDWAVDRVVDALQGLRRLWRRVPLERWYCGALRGADRRLQAGRAHLQAVSARLRCRVAYENVTASLKTRYRRLKGGCSSR